MQTDTLVAGTGAAFRRKNRQGSRRGILYPGKPLVVTLVYRLFYVPAYFQGNYIPPCQLSILLIGTAIPAGYLIWYSIGKLRVTTLLIVTYYRTGMPEFIKQAFLFACYLFAASACLFLSYLWYTAINTRNSPAPNLSDSYTYNEKMRFLHTHTINTDIIATGSSMSLNNLSSEVITQKLHSGSYLNTASWGMSMKDDFLLLKILTAVNKPRTLIIASNVLDFATPDKKVHYGILQDYLASDEAVSCTMMLKTFDLKYYIRNFNLAKKLRASSNNYQYLGFDKYGAVSYDAYNFLIAHRRWNEDFLNLTLLPEQYRYLDSIAVFCRSENINLLFFQSPIRQGLYTALSREKTTTLHTHIDRIQNILAKYDHVFVNATSTTWNDSLFVDGIHLNSTGARLFTSYCLDRSRKPPVPGTDFRYTATGRMATTRF